MAQRKLTLRMSMGVALAFVVGLSTVLLSLAAYEVACRHFRSNLRGKIQSVALLAARLIDPIEHAKIAQKTDETSPSYQSIRALLQSISATNPELRFIYTLRKQSNGLVFVVDAEMDSKLRSAPGDVYSEASESIHNFFESRDAVLVESDFTQDKWGTFLSGYAAIGDSTQGFDSLVGVDVDASFVIDAENELARVIAICTLFTVILVLLVSHYLSGKLSRSVLNLTLEVKKVQNLDLNETPIVRSVITEIDALSTALRAMKKGLKSFKKYVPSDLVNDLLIDGQEASLGTQKKTLTIMFTDIVGFTGISEQLTSEQLAVCMGEYLALLTVVIKDHRGTVDKFIGDSVMALWGAPHDCENHAAMACKAALACQQEIDALNERLQARGLPALQTRIGINTGLVIVGNIGTDERMSFTAIGDPVNAASRLESLNTYYGTRTLVAQATLADHTSDFLSRFVDYTVVKGKGSAIEIHELVGLYADASPAQRQACQQYNDAMKALVQGEVEKAHAGLKLLALADPNDRLLQYQYEVAQTALKEAQNYRYQPRVMQQK